MNEATRKRKDERRQWLNALKSGPCTICHNTFHFAAMDFDHRDPSVKDFNISRMVNRSKEKILAEIAKCDLVCSNCHREKSYKAGQHKPTDKPWSRSQKATHCKYGHSREIVHKDGHCIQCKRESNRRIERRKYSRLQAEAKHASTI